MTEEKITEVKNFLENKPQEIRKRVSIIFDGKQYNLRIPLDFVTLVDLNVGDDEFEFILQIPQHKTEIPSLYGQLVTKNEK